MSDLDTAMDAQHLNRSRDWEDIRMLWTKYDVNWERNFQAVCRYQQKHRDLNISRGYRSEKNVDLYQWLSNRRRHY